VSWTGLAHAEKYTIDPSHTAIIFGVSHLKYSFTYRRFNKMIGSYVLDRANPAASKFEITIDASSIDTNDQKRAPGCLASTRSGECILGLATA
tara:strand:+ start:643 stop:921 length:279 start_codon:yes stop_codon:yes gene_type:complete